MGIAPGLVWLFADWHRQGLLKRGDAVLELGAQELFCGGDPSQINRFVRCFGGEPFSDADLARVADRGLAGELFARVGSPYTSIDYKPFPFGIVMDLNRDVLPAEHHGRYQLVTNHGTSEHIINHWNVMKTMHDATAEGGLMFHNVPFCGLFEHGLFNYNPKFFWFLSVANGYRIVSMRAAVEDLLTQVPVSFERDVEFVPSRPSAQDACLQVLFQKTDDRPFAGLTDTAVMG
jgi:hypothetical protein